MSRALQPGDHLSHYRIVGPLGVGGMGEVYMAQDQSLERSVALKVLPPHLVRNEERVRRFIQEARSASSLSHPHIVTIYEIGQDQVRDAQGQPVDEASEPLHFISMELVSGETLTEKIHQEKTGLRALLGYLAQAAEGLAKAHAAGIVHRDLKPTNIMISKDGYAKVLDFGLAKLVERQQPGGDVTSAPTEVREHTSDGVVMGTVGYMSPEQVRARPVDHRADVFAFGCILYEAATRQRPFAADSDVETMHQILNAKPAEVAELNPEVPSELRRTIRRCLAKNPDQRFQSMKDLAIELREIVEEYDTLSASATSASSLPSGALGAPAPARSPLRTVALAGVAVLGLAGVIFGALALLGGDLWSTGRSGPDGAAPFQDIQISSLLSRNDLREAILSADGRYLAYVSGAAGQVGLRVRQVATGSDVEVLAPRDIPPRGISFTPDGNYLLFISQDPETRGYSALFQVPSLGGSPRKRIFDVDSRAALSPDGRQVCFRRGIPEQQRDTLVIADLESGEERTLTVLDAPAGYSGAPSWSADGQRIAIGVMTPEGGVHGWALVVDVATGAAQVAGPDDWPVIEHATWMADGRGLIAGIVELGRGINTQLWSITYPGGRTARITSDLDQYDDVAVTREGRAFSARRTSRMGNLWRVPADGSAPPRQLTFTSSAEGSPIRMVTTPGGGAVYTAPREGHAHLLAVEPGGDRPRPLTSGRQFDRVEAALPDGSLLVTRYGGDLVPHIWRLSSDGGNATRLTEGSGEDVRSVSPDGSWVLYVRIDQPGSFWRLPLDGTEPTKLLDSAQGGGQISADGRRLLFVRMRTGSDGRPDATWHVLDVDTGESQAVIPIPPRAAGLAWLPAGDGVSYVDMAGGGRRIVSQPLAGGDPVPVAEFPEGRILGYQWSRDGRRLVICLRQESGQGLWIVPVGGGAPKQVASFPTGIIFEYRWSPSDQDLFFTYGDVSQDVVLIQEAGEASAGS